MDAGNVAGVPEFPELGATDLQKLHRLLSRREAFALTLFRSHVFPHGLTSSHRLAMLLLNGVTTGKHIRSGYTVIKISLGIPGKGVTVGGKTGKDQTYCLSCGSAAL